jgi:hypothetical protein
MDLISASASIIALIDGACRLVELLSDIKDGGRERMKLLAEVSYTACMLDSLKDRLDQNLSPQVIQNLTKPAGPLDQCRSIVGALTKELISKDNVAGRVIQRVRWPFRKEDVHQAAEQLHRIHATITQQITLVVTEQIQNDSATARQILDDQQERQIRKWLSPLNFVAQQKAIFENHCPGTGTRLLQSKQFDAWKDSSSKSIMWCKGPPGAGKTYLSSIIVDDLQKNIQPGLDIVLVVYCRYDDPDCQNLANIIGDLLRQCLNGRQLPNELFKLYKTHALTDTRPTYEALLAILLDEIKSFRKCHVVIDALDELADPPDRNLLVAALRPVQAGASTPGFGSDHSTNSVSCSTRAAISLMIISRDLDDIRTAVEPVNQCDCCMGNLSVCSPCKTDFPGLLSSPEYFYHCPSCISPTRSILRGCNICQSCYDAGNRCTDQQHLAMIRRVINLVYDVSADEQDMQTYLQWRIEKDSSLAMVVKKKGDLQDQVLAAVVHASGSL